MEKHLENTGGRRLTGAADKLRGPAYAHIKQIGHNMRLFMRYRFSKSATKYAKVQLTCNRMWAVSGLKKVLEEDLMDFL
jgi:hypothetical protein